MKPKEYLSKFLRIILPETTIIAMLFLVGILLNGVVPFVTMGSILLCFVLLRISSTLKLIKADVITMIDNKLVVSYQNSKVTFPIYKLGIFNNKQISKSPLPLITEEKLNSFLFNLNLTTKFTCAIRNDHETLKNISDDYKNVSSFNYEFKNKNIDEYILLTKYIFYDNVIDSLSEFNTYIRVTFGDHNIRSFEVSSNKHLTGYDVSKINKKIHIKQ